MCYCSTSTIKFTACLQCENVGKDAIAFASFACEMFSLSWMRIKLGVLQIPAHKVLSMNWSVTNYVCASMLAVICVPLVHAIN